MKTSYLYPFGLVLIVLFTAGCETNRISNRIRERPDVFAALAPDQKVYVKDGIVFPGDSLDMAYIALGIPDAVETRERDDVEVIMWTYNRYYPDGELEEVLTQYAQSRNPTLVRSLNIESGTGTISDSVKDSAGHHLRRRGGMIHGSEYGTYSGVGADVSLPDVPVYNLYVFIYRGKISDVMIESLDGTVFLWLEEAIEMEKANKRRKANAR